MATKTISLEIDAYEKLREVKRPGESFSSVVRRLVSGKEPVAGITGAELLARTAGGSGASEEYLDSLEEALQHDPHPDDPWE